MECKQEAVALNSGAVNKMEIIGSTFDESVFEEARKRESAAVLPSYKPKCCEPEWFCHREKYEDALDEQKTMKFRADLKYRKKQYQGALEDYKACLLLVPNNNLSMKRDVLEGIARTYSRLGEKNQALEACEKLRKEATNTCHLTCVLQLELSIHEDRADLSQGIAVLQRLCSIHPFNPWHWFKLATSYQNLLQRLPEDLQDPSEDSTRLKACMSFVRMRLLTEILKIQQFSFVLEKSKNALQVADEALKNLQLEERTLKIISEVMGEDLNPEKMREENQDGEGLSGLTIKDFDERWWNKLRTSLLMKDITIKKSSDIRTDAR